MLSGWTATQEQPVQRMQGWITQGVSRFVGKKAALPVLPANLTRALCLCLLAFALEPIRQVHTYVLLDPHS